MTELEVEELLHKMRHTLARIGELHESIREKQLAMPQAKTMQQIQLDAWHGTHTFDKFCPKCQAGE